MTARGRVVVRWIVGAVVVVALYAALGFWAVPFAVERQLPKLARSDLQRNASVGEIRFNPFTLRLQARDLRLADTDGAPLLSVGELVVQPQWSSLWRRAWTFAEIRIASPQAELVIAPDGRFNLAKLVNTFSKPAPREPASDSSLPRLAIGRFVLQQGKLSFTDRRAGYSNVLTPIDFTLTDFSTVPGQSDEYRFSARSVHGGEVLWHGTASMNPIRGSGELTLRDVSLPELAVYLKPYTQARLAAGQMSTTLPYRFSYADGKFDARLSRAAVELRDLALARQGGADSFASLTHLVVKDVDADWRAREVTVGQVRADAGKLALLRDPKGQLDLAKLMAATAGAAVAASAPAPPRRAVSVDVWKVAVKQVLLDQVAVSALDETVQPPLRVAADTLRVQLQLAAQVGGPELQLKVQDASGSASGLSLARAGLVPVKLAAVGFEQGSVDLAARQAVIGRVYAQGGALQVSRDRQGRINVLDLLPKPGPAAAPSKSSPLWTASLRRADLSGFSAELKDEGSGATLRLKDISAQAQDAGTDLKHPVKLQAGLRLQSGGEIAAQGTLVPDSGALAANVRVTRLALAPLQPLLGRFVKLHLAGGSFSAQGRVTAGGSAKLRYVGSANVAGLVLKEDDGDVFASWRKLGAPRLTAGVEPNMVDIPDLEVTGADAKLIIENDRSFNAARLLVQQPAPAVKQVSTVAAAPASRASEPFPVRIGRVRLRDAKLDFTDLSLRPQFAAKIYELNGVVTGLSTRPGARSQIELDGRVDEYGTMRARGDLNPFAPTDNTDVNVVFKNVDMVPASPYSMKFAGYKVAEGKISLDLQYKLHDRRLEGNNQIVIDRLTLGERVDSPDALKLPLQLAIAILKDKDGRIELGLPVTGNLDDPQFSYGAIIGKALGNLLTRIVTAPFRALAGLFGGGSGEQLQAIDFDAGSDRLQPPEREKLNKVAQILAKRPQLKLNVPAQYGEAADGAALRRQAVRSEVARRAGMKLQAGEDPGPLDLGSRAVRGAIRELYVARFGRDDFDKRKQAAENAAPAEGAAAAAKQGKSAKELVPLWQRVGKVLEGEPQMADATAFYNGLLQRLDQAQPLPPQALAGLGTRRADSVVAALKAAGVDQSRVAAGAPAPVTTDANAMVPLKLDLQAN